MMLEVCVLEFSPPHLCKHNCNTRPCALLGVSSQCHLDLLQVAGQRRENEKFKQFHCYLVSLQVSTTTSSPDEILLFTSISDLSREISSQFQFKLFKIVSEMSGLFSNQFSSMQKNLPKPCLFDIPEQSLENKT